MINYFKVFLGKLKDELCSMQYPTLSITTQYVVGVMIMALLCSFIFFLLDVFYGFLFFYFFNWIV